ncbi:MAG: hypothetical protein AAF602_09865 [Myxococcota bacterium]
MTTAFTAVGWLWLGAPAAAQTPDASIEEAPRRKHMLSTSMFMVANALPDPPQFVQLNYGFRITERDTLLVEAMHWRYPGPQGIPYGPTWGDAEFDFPGFARDMGIGLAYQRFWWKGLFTTVHATPFRQSYHRPDGERIQTGFQLFLVARAGYHIPLWRDRLWIEPSVACTWWPVNTNLPASFAAQEDQWPNYFLAEPGLNIGINL